MRTLRKYLLITVRSLRRFLGKPIFVDCPKCYGGRGGFNCPICSNTGKINEVRALHLRIAKLTKEMTIKDQCLARKNIELDSMHYVWCSGPCEDGWHRYNQNKHLELTEELLKTAETNVARMREKFENMKNKGTI